jgi:hypothetical protein
MEVSVENGGRGRQICGNTSAFKNARADKKFAYVVALARAINALNSAHSLMTTTANRNTPDAIRDRMNAHFFVSGILYETLKLIRAMSRIFTGDQSYETSLRLVIKDASGQALEQMHLKSVRHGGVFHFLPEPQRQLRRRPSPSSYLPPPDWERSGAVFTTILQTSSPQK